MSHTTTRKTAIKDVDTLKKAVARIPGAKYLGLGQGNAFSGRGAHGHQVQLPGWRYPVTIDAQTGVASFDNYSGHWGDEALLDKLKQGYAVEAARSQAAVENREMEEMQLNDGSIKCVIPLGGGGYETEGSSGGGSGGWDV